MDATPNTDSQGQPPEARTAEDQTQDGSDSRRARSGDFSQDPRFDPERLFEVVSGAKNGERVSEAMRAFLARRDAPAFERAVAVFVRSARARGEPVERVLGVLVELAEEREGSGYPHDWTPTDLRRLILRGVLLAFYGDTATTARTTG